MDSNTFTEVAVEMGLPRKLLYSVSEVATVLGVPERTLYARISAGEITVFFPGDRKYGMLMRPEWVERWIEEGTHERTA